VCIILYVNARKLETSESDDSLAQCVAKTSEKLFKMTNSIAVYLSVDTIYQINRTMDSVDLQYGKYPVNPEMRHCTWERKEKFKIPITESLRKGIERELESVKLQEYASSMDRSGHITDIQDQILQRIHKSREISLFSKILFEYDNVVIILQYEYFEQHLKTFMLYSMNLRVLVVLLADNPRESMVRDVLKHMSEPDLSIKDCTVVFQDRLTGVVKLYTWLPYEPPSGKCGKFQDVLFLDDCVGGVFKYNSNIHLHKDVDNLQGCKIGHYGGPDHPPLSTSEIRHDLVEMRITNLKGINANMVRVLAEKLNMTFLRAIGDFEEPDFEIHSISSTNLNRRYRIWTFTPYCALDYTFFVVHSDLYPRWTSLIRVFAWSTWLCTFLCMFLLSLFTKWALRSGSLAQNSLDAWCIILGVGVSNQPKTAVMRIIFLSWILSSLCLNTIYQTFVTSYFVDPGYPRQIDTLEELHSMDTPLLFDYHISAVHISYVKKDSNNSFFLLNSMDSVRYFLGMPNSSIFAHEEIIYHGYKSFCKNLGPKLHKFSKVFNQIHIRLHFLHDRMLQPKMNKIIGRLVDAGIHDKFRRELSTPLDRQTIRDFIEFIPLSLEHLQSLLVLYSIGICISFIVFCFELLITKIIIK